MRPLAAGLDTVTRPFKRAAVLTAMLVFPVIYPRFGQASAILTADITAADCQPALPGEVTWKSVREAYASAKHNADQQIRNVVAALHQFTLREHAASRSQKARPLAH